jgi:hypothetical protein
LHTNFLVVVDDELELLELEQLFFCFFCFLQGKLEVDVDEDDELELQLLLDDEDDDEHDLAFLCFLVFLHEVVLGSHGFLVHVWQSIVGVWTGGCGLFFFLHDQLALGDPTHTQVFSTRGSARTMHCRSTPSTSRQTPPPQQCSHFRRPPQKKFFLRGTQHTEHHHASLGGLQVARP